MNAVTPRVALRDILRATCRHYQTPLNAVMSPRRYTALVRARHVYCFLARNHTQRSFPEIGRALGGRDHTTILYASRKIEMALRDDAQLVADIAAIERTISLPAPDLARVSPQTPARTTERPPEPDRRAEKRVLAAARALCAAREAIARNAYQAGAREEASQRFRRALAALQAAVADCETPTPAPQPKGDEHVPGIH